MRTLLSSSKLKWLGFLRRFENFGPMAPIILFIVSALSFFLSVAYFYTCYILIGLHRSLGFT